MSKVINVMMGLFVAVVFCLISESVSARELEPNYNIPADAPVTITVKSEQGNRQGLGVQNWSTETTVKNISDKNIKAIKVEYSQKDDFDAVLFRPRETTTPFENGFAPGDVMVLTSKTSTGKIAATKIEINLIAVLFNDGTKWPK